MYCTIEDIKQLLNGKVLADLTDDDGTGMVDESKVDWAIGLAEDLIDTYIGTRYSLPLDSVPESIKGVCVDIAIYNLYSRRVDIVPETRKERYQNALKLLQDIAAGKIKLDTGSTEGENQIKGNKLVDDRTFSDDLMDRYLDD